MSSLAETCDTSNKRHEAGAAHLGPNFNQGPFGGQNSARIVHRFGGSTLKIQNLSPRILGCFLLPC